MSQAAGNSALISASRESATDRIAPSVADDLLDIDAVCKFFGGSKPLHPATIYRGLGTRYPRPVRVSPNVNRWLRSECEAALRAMRDSPREPLPSPQRRRAV
jgi:predicted DNA-binding transcriptional regulator AlpA